MAGVAARRRSVSCTANIQSPGTEVYTITWKREGGTINPIEATGTHPFARESKQFKFAPGQDTVGRMVERGTTRVVLQRVMDVDMNEFSRKHAAVASGIESIVLVLQRDGRILELGYEKEIDEKQLAKEIDDSQLAPVGLTGRRSTTDPGNHGRSQITLSALIEEGASPGKGCVPSRIENSNSATSGPRTSFNEQASSRARVGAIGQKIPARRIEPGLIENEGAARNRIGVIGENIPPPRADADWITARGARKDTRYLRREATPSPRTTGSSSSAMTLALATPYFNAGSPTSPASPMWNDNMSSDWDGNPGNPGGPVAVPADDEGAPSVGSIGHPHTCGKACKYFRRADGCRTGLLCDHCHLCKKRRKFHGRSKPAGMLLANAQV